MTFRGKPVRIYRELDDEHVVVQYLDSGHVTVVARKQLDGDA